VDFLLLQLPQAFLRELAPCDASGGLNDDATATDAAALSKSF
jgi:hypothetical protein